MLKSLDLSSVLDGTARKRGDYAQLRPMVFGTLDPKTFLSDTVERVRKSDDQEDLNNPLQPVYWLAKAYDSFVVEGGLTERSGPAIRYAFQQTIDSCTLSPRERLQIWYSARSVGVEPPADGPGRVLGVIVETCQDGEPVLLFCGPDRSALALWEGSSAFWPSYEEGVPGGLSDSICRRARSKLSSMERTDDPPPPPASGDLRVSVATRTGIYSVCFDEEHVEGSPLFELYNEAIVLLRILCGENVDQEYLATPTMDLEESVWVYPSVWKRGLAFGVDILVFSLLAGMALWFLSSRVQNWGIISLFAMAYFVGFFLPLLLAWMESSQTWGYRTIGKSLFGFRVLSIETTSGPRFFQACARNFAKCYLSPLFVGVGFFWAFFHDHRRAWHDILGFTVVVSNDDYDL